MTRTKTSINKLLNWIGIATYYDESFFADFFLSPTILTYADRPTILHCFFQSDIPLKYREQAEALFKSEEDLYQLCQKYKADYF